MTSPVIQGKRSYSQTLPALIQCVDLAVLVERYAGTGRIRLARENGNIKTNKLNSKKKKA